MKTLISFWIFISCFILHSHSQTMLESHLNSFRAGDEIIKQQIEFITPDKGGRNIVWDFSHQDIIDDNYPVIYFHIPEEDSLFLYSREHHTRYLFEQDNESVMMKGYKNSSVQMSFDLPEIQIQFPFQYGDTISAPFRGEGLYYHETEITAEGRTFIHADAEGILITPGSDTLKNVLRVKRIREYSSIGIDNATMRLETYNWYARGYRYPIFESVRSFSIIDGKETEDFATSFYFPLVGIESLEADTENESLREEIKIDRGLLIECSIYPNPVTTSATLSFGLASNALVTVRICNVVGSPISTVRQEMFMKGSHNINLPVESLQPGNYLLHVQADNYVKRQILIKK